MTSVTIDGVQIPSQEETTLDLDRGKLTVTLSDVQEMGEALTSYLKNSTDEMRKTLPQNLVGSVPVPTSQGWIDETDIVRWGGWILESHGDRLSMAHRSLQPDNRLGYQLVAHLESESDKWIVTKMTFRRLRR